MRRPEVRRKGVRKLFAGYASQRDLLADMLVQTIEARNAIAHLKGHGSAIDEAAFNAYVTPAHFDALLAEVARHAPAYQREYADLLNPEHGRAGLAGGENRLPITGTASVYPTGSSVIYRNEFQGSLLDLIMLAHEGGHAVQAQLMYRNNVPTAYAAGPGYFTESLGRFQELLLLEHLYGAARTREEKKLMRDAFAARLLSIFPSAEDWAAMPGRGE